MLTLSVFTLYNRPEKEKRSSSFLFLLLYKNLIYRDGPQLYALIRYLASVNKFTLKLSYAKSGTINLIPCVLGCLSLNTKSVPAL